MKLDQIPPPSLPIPSDRYDRLYHQQHNNILRLFFNAITRALNALFGTHGGQYISTPAGEFISAATQTPTAAATPKLVTLDTTTYSSGMHYSPGNGLYADVSGVYNVQFSIQFTNTAVQDHDVDIWLRKNGGDIANSASVATVPSLHGNQPGYLIVAASFFVTLNAGDYVELWWAASSTSVQINYLPAITTPFTSPGSPSVVVSLSMVNAT